MVIYFIRLALLISIILYSLTAGAQTDSTKIIAADTLAMDAENRDDSLKKAGFQNSLFNSKVKFKAKDSIFIDLKERKVYLYGEAEVYYEKLELKGAIITLDFKTSEIFAQYATDSTGKKTGLPNFKQDGQNIDADKIGYNFKTKRAKISNLVMKEGEGRIYGDRVVKDQDNNIYVGDAKYTTCDAEHPHFYIHAPRLKIVPGKQIVTGPANLVIADIPTPAWIPFGFFPVRQGRKSGIIMPGYGFSPGQGYFLRNGGYYFGLSDYFDLALTGDAYTQGTWAIRGSSTYAKRYKYSGNIQVAYANNQQGSPEDVSGFSRQRNYNIIWNHRLDPKARPNTNFNASVNYQSPSYLQYNSYNPATIIQSQVNSSVNYNRVLAGGKYSFNIATNASQNNQTKDVSLSLPQFTFDVLRFFPFKRKEQIGDKRWYEDIGVNYSFNLQNNINTKDSLLLKKETLENMRNGGIHRASFSTQFKALKWFSLNPSLSVNEYWYLQSVNKTWNKDSLRVETDTIREFTRAADFSFNTSLTTMLYGTFPIKAGPVQAVRHVMTITGSLGFKPDFSDAGYGIYQKVQADSQNTKQELYSRLQGGIFGGPAAGRVGQLGLNINNNLEMKLRKKTDTGYREEKVKIFESFNFSGAYNFFAEQKKMSNITANARTVLFKQLSILFNGFNFSPYAVDSTGEREGVEYLYKKTGQPLRFTEGSIAVSTSINSTMFDGKKDENDNSPAQPGVNSLQKAALMANPNLTAYELAILSSMGDYVNFNIPWSLTLNYSYNYSKPGVKNPFITQTMLFSGDMNLTENWKIAFSSGYDLTQKQVNLTSIDFFRQLHCWEFKLSWIPIGPRQYFLFNLNVKSSVLQDLKINRRRDWFDNN